MNMRRFLIVSAGLACLAEAAAAQQGQPRFERPYWLDKGVIEEIGRARVEASPDRANFTVTFSETAHEAGDATAAAADRARAATAAIRSRGGAHVEIHSALDVQANYSQYTDRQGQRQTNARPDEIESYTAAVTLAVTVTEIGRASDVRAAALAVRPQSISDLHYDIRLTTQLGRRAYTAAVEDAAARARAAAEAAGVHVGALLALQEGQGPCMGSWYSSGAGYENQAAPPPPPPPPPPPEADIVVATGHGPITIHPADIDRLQLPNDPPPIEMQANVCAVYAVAP
jgi:uncharacterized protein YggE